MSGPRLRSAHTEGPMFARSLCKRNCITVAMNLNEPLPGKRSRRGHDAALGAQVDMRLFLECWLPAPQLVARPGRSDPDRDQETEADGLGPAVESSPDRAPDLPSDFLHS